VQQSLVLADAVCGNPRHPIVGVQKDIRYYGTTARGLLNSPEATGMSFASINPYVGCAFGCAYCYARYAHRFVMERAAAASDAEVSLGDDLDVLPAWQAFEQRIFVKRNAADVLRRTLRERRESLGDVLRTRTIVIGTATDPYQPGERSFRVTRSILDVLVEASRLKLVIITKSPLITRDIDLLTRIAARSTLTVHLSLITLDRDLARRIEPRAPTPEARLRALRRLRAAGIETGVNIMPVLPGITDRPDALAALVRRIAAEGASHVNPSPLRLRATARKRYLPFLAAEFPHLVTRYASAYAHRHEMTDEYRDGLRRFMKRLCAETGLHYGTPDEREFYERRAGAAWDTGAATEEAQENQPRNASVQLDLLGAAGAA
jgi:DNA repair photolyase